MRLQGEHRFGSSRWDVWHALQDPQMLADSLPGVRRFEVEDADRYKLTITVGVGAVKGTYAGTLSLDDKREPEACRILAEARGAPGSVSTTALMRLAELDGGGTLLSYEADARVTGPLAGVGQRMIQAAARKTTHEFLEALDRRLTAGPATTGAAAPTDALAAPAPGLATASAEGPVEDKPMVTPASAPARRTDYDFRLFVGGSLVGFAMAIIGVLIGRRTARE